MQYETPKPKAIGAPTRTKASEAKQTPMGLEADTLDKPMRYGAWEKLTGGRCNDTPAKLSRKAQRLADAKERRKDNPTKATIKEILAGGKKRAMLDRAKARSLKREALRDEGTPEARKAMRKMSDSWQGRVPRNVQGFYKAKDAKPRAVATMP